MYFGGGISGAAGGAMMGTAIAPGIGTAIGAGLGFLSGLFGDSPEEQTQKKIEQGMKYLKEARRNTIITGMDRLSKNIAKSRMSSQLGAGRRALASGNSAEAESIIAPVVSRTEATGAEATNQFMESTNRSYDNAELQLQMEGLNTPLQPSVGDYLLPVGQAALNYKLNKDYVDTLSKMGPAGVSGNTVEAGPISAGPVSKIEGARNPVLSGEFAATGDNAPLKTLGMGAFRAPQAPRLDRMIPRTFGRGNVYPTLN
jgi:hypothetical protein